MRAGRVQGHGGLGVVPRVEVVAAKPRDGAVGALHGEQARDGGAGLLLGQDPGQDEVFRPGSGHLAAAVGVCGLVA